MEGLTELIPFLLKDSDPHIFNDFLKTCKELKVFVKNANESVPLINSLLNKPESRLNGLRLLAVYTSQCPKSIISDNIVQWFHQCIKSMLQPTSSIQFSVSSLLLCSLLEVSTEFPDVKKCVSQVFMPRILDIIVGKHNKSLQSPIPTLKCLFSCLKYYGKCCGNNRDHLEKLLVDLLNSEGCVILHVSKCFHLLAQAGAAGAESVNYKQNWQTQQSIIINSLQYILDQLFCDVNEILGTFNQTLNEKGKLDIPPVTDENPLLKAYKLSRIFCNLCKILETMLLDSFPTSKIIYPEAILRVICRSLAVTCKTLLAKISNSTYALMAQLCDIHISVVKLLNSLILCGRSNILPFSTIISRLFTQIFKWTSVVDWPYGQQKPFSTLRQVGYKCLSTWLSVGKSCSMVETQLNIIIEAIVKDIKFDKKVISLNLEKKALKGKASKNTIPESSEKNEINGETCSAALACIPSLLQMPLSSTAVKNLQEVVVKILFEIQRCLRCHDELPSLYFNASCRAHLYSALMALCISPHPHFPPPLHYANIIFNSASSDNDFEVTRVCSLALSSIAHMLRPCAPSFDFHANLDSEIIPINPNPEPSEKENKAIDKRACREIITKQILLKQEVRNAKAHNIDKYSDAETKVLDDSLPGGIDEQSVTLVHESKENNSEIIAESPPDKQGTEDDLIDLADSSDESLILLDPSQKNFDYEYLNNSKNVNFKTISNDANTELISIVDSTGVESPSRRATRSKVLKGTTDSHLKKGLETESELSMNDNSEDLTIVEPVKIVLDKSDNETNSESCTDEINIIESNEKTPPRKYTRSSNASVREDVIVLDSNNCGNGKTKKRNIISEDVTIVELDVSPPSKRFTRSCKKSGLSNEEDIDQEIFLDKSLNAEKRFSETKISDDISIIESDIPPSPRRFTRSSKASASDTVDLDPKSFDKVTKPNETQISEDISIIEPSNEISSSRRQTQNFKSSINATIESNQNDKDVSSKYSPDNDITLIQDEEEPPTKKSRANKNCMSNKINGKMHSGKDENNKKKSNECVCEEDNEMLNSFVDSVAI